jgi:pimeloyl-ACP methyl ester carboxylesterase
MPVTRSADGTSIGYETVGSGPLIVLVAGALQYRAIDPPSRELARLVAAGGFTVVTYDRRGRGESGDTAGYDVLREVEDLGAVTVAVGETARAFGMSSGGVLLLHALAAGVPITRFALYEPPFIVDEQRPPLAPSYGADLDRLIADGRRSDAVALFMTEAAGVPADYVGALRAEPFWPAFEAVAPTLVYDARVMGQTMSGRPLDSAEWATIAASSLVLTGGDSPPHQHAASEALASLLPNARSATLAGQTHMVAPQALAPVLVDFFVG